MGAISAVRLDPRGGLNWGKVHGQQTKGGVTNFSKTTAQSTCCTAGRFRQSRHAAATSGIKIAIVIVFCASHQSTVVIAGLAFRVSPPGSSIICRNRASSAGRKTVALGKRQNQWQGLSVAQLASQVVHARVASRLHAKGPARKTNANWLLSLAT